jgi:transcription-repair coupling factor (superfamily II helicase)
MEHGEYATRGALLDLFPMGSDQPYRLDFFDDEIDSLRLFDVDSQRTLEEVAAINLLPAHEFPPIRPPSSCSAASGATALR